MVQPEEDIPAANFVMERGLALRQAYYCYVFATVEPESVPDRAPNPENIAIKRDLFKKLSAEAKAVVSIISSSPACVLTDLGRISKVRLIEYLKMIGWSNRKIVAVSQELREYAGELEELE